jgi:hypothetical protein
MCADHNAFVVNVQVILGLKSMLLETIQSRSSSVSMGVSPFGIEVDAA